MLVIYCDGAMLSHRQEKPCFAAFVALDGDEPVAEWSNRILADDVTAAELRAVLEALRWAARNGLSRVKVVTDSQAAAYAVFGGCRKYEKYRSVLEQIRALLRRLRAALEWAPREMNRLADRLCRRAAREYQRKFPVMAG